MNVPEVQDWQVYFGQHLFNQKKKRRKLAKNTFIRDHDERT